jgi:hypothetical protein
MSVFGKIMSAIFGSKAEAAPAPSATASPAAPSATAEAAPSITPTAGAGAQQPVDVEAVVSGFAAKKKEKLDWRHSIVDLMKVLDLDSSLAARKELATELGYSGKLDGSAEMNLWLHKQVMKKLAENGGKVPADLKD